VRSFPARVDGERADVGLGRDALVLPGDALAWVDLDHVAVDGPRVHVATHDGRACTVSHLAGAFDAFVAELVELRARARRAALLQWTGDAPLVVVDAKRGTERVRVHVFPDAVTVEPLTGVPDMLPLSCVVALARDGYDLALRARGLPDVHVRHAGSRTDELVERIERARSDLAVRTAAAYAQLSPGLAGLDSPDGWAVDAGAAGSRWPALRAAVAGHRRAHEIDTLERLTGGGLRLGVRCGPGGAVLPFALAPVGDRVAVEATDADDRATFVFATRDLDRLNATLLVTSFRREAISLPHDRLGRWALAVRTLGTVRWARDALVARVVHGPRWADDVAAALRG